VSARRTATAFLGALLCVAGIAAIPAAPAAAATCATVTTDNRCGMDLERAWKLTKGDPHVLISYVEGGVNWRDDTAKDFADRVFINWHETPVPCAAKTKAKCHRIYSTHRTDYDPNHDGFVNAADWGKDPRVSDKNGNGYIDAEDVLVAFSDGVDHDHNGYPSDISGWDFYDHQNDSATYDSAYGHSDGQMSRIHHECPDCMILPIKAGAEALDRTNDLAEAWLYTADVGGSVVASTTADLGYSSFMRQAVSYLTRKGVVMVESSNDFDSTDHQGGMWWPQVLPGNGVVLTSDGSGWIRSDYTSWGTHSMFSVTTNGGTTSESTPTTAGVVGLLLSWGRQAAKKHLIRARLSGPEAVQVLRQTARSVTDATLGWPGSKGEWNLQYGYGIPDLYDAMRAIREGGVPAAARIDAPQWYQLSDPTTSSTVKVRGTIDARRATGFKWVLQAGIGPQPTEKQWFAVGKGSGHKRFHGTLGTLKLSKVPHSVWSKPFALSQTKSLESTEQYTVSFRLKVTDADGHLAEDRRSIAVTHDDTWLTGFPLRLHASGESQPALVDLQGSGNEDVVFGDADGYVHAIDPQSGEEIPGWPVHTAKLTGVRPHKGVKPGFEPILGDVAVGALNHDGKSDVVVTSTSGTVYAFDAQGHRLDGWPKALDRGVQKPAIPRPDLPYTRLPIQGSVTGPVLFDLNGDQKLEIVQVGWDGYIHVWGPDGSDLQGWPVKVVAPSAQPPPNYVMVNDQKLDTPPAVGFLQGQASGADIVLRPQYTFTQGSGLQPGGFGFVYAYGADGSLLPGFPTQMASTVEFYGSAQEFITEGSAAPVTADVTGTGAGPDMIAVGPVLSPPYLINGAGQIQATYGATPSFPPSPGSDVPVAFTTSGAFGKMGGALTFAQAETGGTTLATSLLNPNSGTDIKEYESAYPATGGSARPGFPATRQGIDFLGEPIFVDVTGDGDAEILDGGDSNAIHAYDSTGAMAAGFPKWTTGWNVFSPAAGDLLGGGKVDLVTVTREGYLFVWSTDGTPAGLEWWRAQHDEWNSGRYGTIPH
jgi:hypothetical protein